MKLKEELICFKAAPSNWKEAIRVSSELLLANEYITPAFVDKMIANVDEFGPYIVIAPGIAIPHSRPEHGVLNGGASITIFDQEIDVQGFTAKAFITLACSHDTEHLEMLAQVAKSLASDADIERFINATSKEQILKIWRNDEHSN